MSQACQSLFASIHDGNILCLTGLSAFDLGDGNLATGNFAHSRQGFDKLRLAIAFYARDTKDLTGPYIETYAVQYFEIAIVSRIEVFYV